MIQDHHPRNCPVCNVLIFSTDFFLTTSGIRNNSAWNRRFWNKITIVKRNESAWKYLRVGVSIQECHVLTNVTNTICFQGGNFVMTQTLPPRRGPP